MTATLALIRDTFREAIARKIFWGLFGLSTLMILFFLFVMKIDIVAGATEGLAHGFLVEAADGRLIGAGREPRIWFRHELIAEAIAADLLPATRRRYHAALAAAGKGDPSLVQPVVEAPTTLA